MAYNYQTRHIPFGYGLNSKADPRALEAPELAVARDVQFDEGGLSTRKPYAALGSDILGGGTIEDGRRVVTNAGELLLFTKSALYSWSAADTAWVLKGTYLAPVVEETPRFIRTSEQTQCDRAELGGVVFYAWLDTAAAANVFLAAIDDATGAVLLTPTQIGSGTSRPRLVALDSKVLLFVLDSTNLKAVILDPTDIATTAAVTPTTITACNNCYDVVANSGEAVVAVRKTPTTGYGLYRITAALATAASVTPARSCDGPISLAVDPDGEFVQVVRGNTDDIQGDLLALPALTDVYTAQAIGTATSSSVNQIAVAYRSVVDGASEYVAHAFWSADETSNGSSSFETGTNSVNTAGTIGTESTLLRDCGVASRAFDYDGEVYVWLAFAGESEAGMGAAPAGFRAQLQNNYFLYRDDGLLVAKAGASRAGGFSEVTGHLPNVQDIGDNTFAWCGVERELIDLGGNHGCYGARAPREIRLTMDSDAARRCCRIGRTLYIAGGQVMQYDGEGLAEVGFHVYPWYFDALDGGAAAGSGKDATSPAYKCTYRWPNAAGDVDNSTTATVVQPPVTAGNKVVFSSTNLHATLKTDPRSEVATLVWGTLDAPSDQAPFYLVTSKDPSDTSNPNRYLENDPTAAYAPSFEDELPDADLAALEENPENGGVLENLAPPPASIVAATSERVFLAGVAGDPDRVWYSKLRNDGEVAAFHDALTVDIPHEGGAITALGFIDGLLFVFRETAVYAVPGEGFSNASDGQNYGPARRTSIDVGAVSAEAVGVTPAGLMFKSRKGWYMQPPGGAPQYIGARVAEFDDDEVKSVHVVEAQHQVRCLTGSRMLVYDYEAGQWAEWTIADGLGATIWDGTYVYATDTGAKSEQSTYNGLDYGFDVETAWLKPDDLQGFGAVAEAMVLGEFRSAFDMRVRIAYDYAETDAAGPTWLDDKYWAATPATVGAPLQMRHGPKRHRCQSFKVRLTAYASNDTINPPSGEAARLTGLGLKLGVEPGQLFRRLPANQTQ